MVICYLDTSAAMKLLVDGPEPEALSGYLGAAGERELVASWLLHTELHRATDHHPNDIDLQSVGIVLDTVSLVDITRGDMLTAGTLPERLRSNDAIHLAAALRLSVDEVLTYDAELSQTAFASGLQAVRPA